MGTTGSALPGALRLLVVERSAETAKSIRLALEQQPAIRVHIARGSASAAKLIEQEPYDAILIDDHIWTDGESRVGTLVRRHLPDAAVIVLTDDAATSPAFHVGAHDCIDRGAIVPEQLVARLDAAVAETRGARRRETLVRWLERDARTDKVTGLFSKSTFDEELRDACEDSGLSGRPLTLVRIAAALQSPDTGTECTLPEDETLRRTAAGLSRAIRSADYAARVGDAAFGVILRDADMDLGRRMARRITQEVDRLNSEAWPGEPRVVLTFGVATAVGADPAALVEAADEEILHRRPLSLVMAGGSYAEQGLGPSVA
ncbi:MAG: diguanylate cyclase [Dehalococcoidia bacterium]